MQLTFLQEDLLRSMQGKAGSAAGKKASAKSQLPLLPLAAKPAAAPARATAPAVKPKPAQPAAAPAKSETAFKTISEAADMLGVQQHVLRFWESKFPQIKPTKLAGGRRYYRPEDMDVLSRIHHLLYKQGYTIKGALKAFSKPDDISLAQKISSLPKINVDKTKAHFSQRELGQIAAIRGELIELKETLRPYI